MKRLIIYLSLFLTAFAQIEAQNTDPATIPAPLGSSPGVYDPADNLTPAQKSEISSRLEAIDRSTSVGGAVAVVASTGDYSPQEFATLLFENWKPGHKDNDNGFILLVALEQRTAFIVTGYGLEGLLTDITCAKITREYFVPQMRDGNLFGAITDTLTEISRIISDPDHRDELMSGQTSGAAGLSDYDFWQIIFWICTAVFLFSILLFCFDLYKGRHLNQYEKATLWRSHLSIFWICAVFSFGAGLLTALMALWLTRLYRTKPVRCDTCGARMKKLNEEEDNQLLSPAQDLEERLDTVDYDVWVCPDCGTVERFPFRQNQSEYSECPRCHTVAQHLIMDKVIVQPTTRREGLGERQYKCEYCDNHHTTRYKIPRKQDNAALLAGAALGAAAVRGGGSRGGGGWGGPFGGGMTGGGGGGASW